MQRVLHVCSNSWQYTCMCVQNWNICFQYVIHIVSGYSHLRKGECRLISSLFYSNLRRHAHTQIYTILIRTDTQDIQTQLYINRNRADQLHVMQSCKHNSRRPETQATEHNYNLRKHADTHTQPNTTQTVTPSCKFNATTKIQQGLATGNGKIGYLHFLYDELYFDCNTCFFTTEYWNI